MTKAEWHVWYFAFNQNMLSISLLHVQKKKKKTLKLSRFPNCVLCRVLLTDKWRLSNKWLELQLPQCHPGAPRNNRGPKDMFHSEPSRDRCLSRQHSAADLQAAASEVCVCVEVLTCQGGLVRTLTPTAGGLQTTGSGIDLKLVLSNLMITSRLVGAAPRTALCLDLALLSNYPRLSHSSRVHREREREKESERARERRRQGETSNSSRKPVWRCEPIGASCKHTLIC